MREKSELNVGGSLIFVRGREESAGTLQGMKDLLRGVFFIVY
jgi:hypothetical protein